MRTRTVLLLVSLMALSMVSPAVAQERLDPADPWVAMFESELMDLRGDWGEAQACAVWADDVIAECFRTEAGLLKRAAERDAGSGGGVAPLASSTCSSSVKLYDGTSYTGPALYLYQRTSWINLSNYGWANRTSSYKIGACSAYFADYPNGGGGWYPTSSTEAWDQSSTMISGWNNRVSSVYIR